MYTDIAAENINKLLKKYSQAEFGKLIGVAQSTVSKLRADLDANSLSDRNIERICRAIKCTKTALLNTRLYPDSYSRDEIFEQQYYAYFLTKTDCRKVDTAIIKIQGNEVVFTINLKNKSKVYGGTLSHKGDFVTFFLDASHNDTAHAVIMMSKPQVAFPHKYLGGMGILLMPAILQRHPCAQRIIVSKIKLTINSDSSDYKFLMQYLSLQNDAYILVDQCNDTEVIEYIVNRELYRAPR